MHSLKMIPSNFVRLLSENHSRYWLGIFGRRNKPHPLAETRVSTETDVTSSDVPTVNMQKNE